MSVGVSPSVIDQDVSHHLCADGEEVCAILPVKSLLTRQLQISLVHERGCLQRMTRALLAHLSLGNPAEFRMYERQELIQCGTIAFTPVGEQLGDFVRRGRGHRCAPWRMAPFE